MSIARFTPLAFDKKHLVALMREDNLAALLLTSPENVFYATGYPTLPGSGNPILYALRNVLPFYALIDREGYTTLVCWGGAALGVEYGVDAVRTFADRPEADAALSDLLSRILHPGARCGIESACPYTAYRLLLNCLSAEDVVIADRLLITLRLIKSEAEIALLEKSTQVVEATVADLMDSVYIGMTRPKLMRAARVGMMRHGASGIDHITISFGGSNPEVEIDEQLEANKLVTLDLGAVVGGYISDNRRLMYTGEIPAGMAALHRTMCGIVDELGEALRPSKTFGEIYRLAMGLYEKHGLKPFIPNVGHSIGLQVEEVWIYGESEVSLQPGMVLNIELYALYETGELIGDEETFVVRAGGPVRITRLPRDIRPAR